MVIRVLEIPLMVRLQDIGYAIAVTEIVCDSWRVEARIYFSWLYGSVYRIIFIASENVINHILGYISTWKILESFKESLIIKSLDTFNVLKLFIRKRYRRFI